MKPCAGKTQARRLPVAALLGFAVALGTGLAPGVEAAVPIWGTIQPPAYREEPVTIGEAPWELEGILTLPDQAASFPAVVLVADFGPYDRDATTGPDKPFRDLARGLAERGIASLRYDKRTAVYGPKMDGNSITVEEDVIEDSLAAAELLRGIEGVEALFVLGHGLGATLAPEIARRAGADGAVLLAPFVTPLDELVLRQLENVLAADGMLTLAEEDQIARARASVDQFRRGQTDPPQTFLGPSRYFVDLRRRDPARQAAQFTGPMLFLQGGRDEQVPPSEQQRWRELLGHRQDVTFRLYPYLNHTFALGPDPSPTAPYRWRRPVDDLVIETISQWILRQARPEPVLPEIVPEWESEWSEGEEAPSQETPELPNPPGSVTPSA